MRSTGMDDDGGGAESGVGVGCELITSQFHFVPLHRIYQYNSGGLPARTIVVAEVNLPSGVGPGMYWMKVVESGTVLEITVEWPEYLLNPLIFNATEISDSPLLLQSSHIAASQKSAQDIMRDYGNAHVKSKAKLILPCKVEEGIEFLKEYALGFEDNSEVAVKAKWFGYKGEISSVEEFSMETLSVGSPFRLDGP